MWFVIWLIWFRCGYAPVTFGFIYKCKQTNKNSNSNSKQKPRLILNYHPTQPFFISMIFWCFLAGWLQYSIYGIWSVMHFLVLVVRFCFNDMIHKLVETITAHKLLRVIQAGVGTLNLWLIATQLNLEEETQQKKTRL